MDISQRQEQFHKVEFEPLFKDSWRHFVDNFVHYLLVGLQFYAIQVVIEFLFYLPASMVWLPIIIAILFYIFVFPILYIAFFKNIYELKTKGHAQINIFAESMPFFRQGYWGHVGFFWVWACLQVLGVICLVIGVFFTLSIFTPGFCMRQYNTSLTVGQTLRRCWAAGMSYNNWFKGSLASLIIQVIIIPLSLVGWLSTSVFWLIMSYIIFGVIITILGIVFWGIFVTMFWRASDAEVAQSEDARPYPSNIHAPVASHNEFEQPEYVDPQAEPVHDTVPVDEGAIEGFGTVGDDIV
ncbi:hypothetical protein ADUPG1_010706 [Aduncisulcus paluster]|uniref:Uncharacterized protein n=1 Tax=Aduncisulcus paluster TaxID=2918883 RepID=A0ABQ5JSH2_9EUKA|nr:hypothetical protein ADUPG1_010706 [Aduncisulcus paluster]